MRSWNPPKPASEWDEICTELEAAAELERELGFELLASSGTPRALHLFEAAHVAKLMLVAAEERKTLFMSKHSGS